METWKIVIGIVVLFALGLLVFFDQYCREKYDHAFLSKRALTISMGAMVFLVAGNIYCQIPHRPPKELIAVSWTLFAICAAIFVYLIYENIKATNYWVGLAGSAIQIPLLAFIAMFALTILTAWLIFLLLSHLLSGRPETETEKRRREEHDAWWNSKENKAGPNYQKPTKYH